MKILIDFFPIVLFFVIYKVTGSLYTAVAVLMGSTLLQMLWTRYRTGKFEKGQVITFGLLLVLGGATLIFRDPAFVMWKVSAVYVVFALVLMGSLWIGKKTLAQRMLGRELELPSKVWRQLTMFWGIGFIGIALVNAYYVELALSARSQLFNQILPNSEVELSQIECVSTTAAQLCLTAQQAEATWVNFKLFGTLGLTVILMVITMAFVYKYIKDK